MGPSNQSQISLTPWQQENCPGPADLVSRDFSAIHYEGHLKQITSSTTPALGEPKNIQHQKLASADVYKQYLLHFSNQAESSQILRGYPLHELNKKEMNGHADLIGCEKHGTIPPNQFLLPDLYQEICNGSKPPHTVASLLVLSRCQEQSSMDHLKSHSQCSSDTEHSCLTGDFKLFGKKIISQPSTLQKNIPITQETNNKVSSSLPESSSKSFKLTTDVNYSGLKELPTRSYGFWDGSRIQTGFSSLPDSAILLARYPTAFSNHPASSLGLPAVIKKNDRNMGCASVFPSTDLSGNGHLSDYQAYNRSYDRTTVQPFAAADVKRHEALCKQ